MEGWNSWDRVTSGTFAQQHTTYSYVRYKPNDGHNSLCDFTEIEIIGKIVLSDITDAKTCDAKVMRGTTQLKTEASAVAYADTNTPTVSNVSPRYIEVAGGEQVTLTGTQFSGTVIVKIDGLVCASPALTGSTTIKCNTAARNALTEPSLQVEVGDLGYASTRGLTFLYVHKWSDDASWSGEFAPQKGDSIHIPKG